MDRAQRQEEEKLLYETLAKRMEDAQARRKFPSCSASAIAPTIAEGLSVAAAQEPRGKTNFTLEGASAIGQEPRIPRRALTAESQSQNGAIGQQYAQGRCLEGVVPSHRVAAAIKSHDRCVRASSALPAGRFCSQPL